MRITETGYRKLFNMMIESLLSLYTKKPLAVYRENLRERFGNIETSCSEKLNDNEMRTLISEGVVPLGEEFEPDALVIRSGADALLDDPQSQLSLSNLALWDTVKCLIKLSRRVLVLGGEAITHGPL